jgi:putative sterol carrier protein
MADAELGSIGDQSDVDVEALVRTVDESTDEELEAAFAANRDVLLAQIFRQMEENFDGEAAGETAAVIHWKILGRPDGGSDLYEMVIRSGTCRIGTEPAAEPDATISLGPVALVRMITGRANAMRLFTFGKLRARGDLSLAARLPALFRMYQGR